MSSIKPCKEQNADWEPARSWLELQYSTRQSRGLHLNSLLLASASIHFTSRISQITTALLHSKSRSVQVARSTAWGLLVFFTYKETLPWRSRRLQIAVKSSRRENEQVKQKRKTTSTNTVLSRCERCKKRREQFVSEEQACVVECAFPVRGCSALTHGSVWTADCRVRPVVGTQWNTRGDDVTVRV